MNRKIISILSMLLLLFIAAPNVHASNLSYSVNTFTADDMNEYVKLQPLPYAVNALEPFIDAETMTLHHDKHEQAYVNNLNAAMNQVPELKSKSLEELLANPRQIPKNLRKTILNNGGGVYNHNFFWFCMSPTGGGNPNANIGEAIEKQFGSYENFKTEFEKAALSVFGSGWAWLLSDSKGNLFITTTANQDTPIPLNKYPIIGLDVWEHAYYLKYQNRRNEYISAFWNIVNWDFAENNYLEVLRNE